MMYPARIPLTETQAGLRGRQRLWLPTRAVSTSRPTNGAWGKGRYPDANPPTPPRVLPEGTRRGGRREWGGGRGGAGKTDPEYSSPEKDLIGSRRENSC